MRQHNATSRTVRDVYADCGVAYPERPHKRGSGEVAARVMDWVELWTRTPARLPFVRPGRADPPMSTTRAAHQPYGGSE